MYNMNIIFKQVDEVLWREAKAQCVLENRTLKGWVEEAVSNQLGIALKSRDSHLKKRLPNKAKCADCGKEVIKGLKGMLKMIVHHEGTNRDPTVAVILCPGCHAKRHAKMKCASGYLYPKTHCTDCFHYENCSFEKKVAI